jgi:hypothetical protein
MYKSFKSKTGMVFSTLYLLICVAAVIELETTTRPPDMFPGMSVVALSLPWNVMFFEVVKGLVSPDSWALFFYPVFIVSVLVNASLLYLFGLLLSRLFRVFSGGGRTPQV